MAFVNISLIAGALTIGIPIVLHLMMRQRPKQLIFPALRFVQPRRDSNQRTLQLRHWLLLLLRCLALGLFALLLARPSVSSTLAGNWLLIGLLALLTLVLGMIALGAWMQRRGWMLRLLFTSLALAGLLAWVGLSVSTWRQGGQLLIGNQEAPVAAVLVMDTSARMNYRHQNQTRIDDARETARWLIRQLPVDSQVAVMTTGWNRSVFSVDLAAALRSLDRLQANTGTRDLASVLGEAVTLAKTNARERKEIYVFTDLSAGAWPSGQFEQVRTSLEEAADVLLYVVDVGVESPQNLALGNVRLSQQRIPQNSAVQLEVPVRRIGQGIECTVELHVEDLDLTRPVIRDGKTLLPQAELRGQQAVALTQDGSDTVRFELEGLTSGFRQGWIRILGQDNLPVDDLRHFTVEVQPAWPVLVVANLGTDTVSFTEAIAPYQYAQTNRTKFQCTVIPQAELATHSIDDYVSIHLLDPQPLTTEVWNRLEAYLVRGGSLACYLGRNLTRLDSFQTAEALRVLPARPSVQFRSGGNDLFLAPQGYDHPILTAFRDISTSVPWNEFPVYRHWGVSDMQSDSRVVVRYGNGEAALLTRGVGKGRVVMMTTPVTDVERNDGRPLWNELTGPNDWPRFLLINGIADFLSRTGDSRLNYEVGEAVTLSNDPERYPEQYQLFPPDEEPMTVRAVDAAMQIRSTLTPGAYRLKGERGGPVVRSFSVNLSERESELDRIDRAELDQRLGAGRFQYARGQDEITRVQGQLRSGREFYPFLLIAVALILASEQLLANRFYRHD